MDDQQVALPMNDQQVILPVNDQQATLSVNDQQVILPVNGQQVILPVNDQQVALPVNDQQVALPVNDQQVILPVNDQQATLSVNDQQVTLPVNGQQVILPVNDQQVTLPMNDQQVASVDISTKTIYKVKPNDSLSKIANEYFGDETEWDKIFQANKDNLSDPNSLYVGQELLIPDVSVEKAKTQAFRAAPMEKKPEHDIAVNAITHTVQSGDSLYKVSGKYYHDPTMWRKIYEANEETLEGQDLLRKGQILIIPQ